MSLTKEEFDERLDMLLAGHSGRITTYLERYRKGEIDWHHYIQDKVHADEVTKQSLRQLMLDVLEDICICHKKNVKDCDAVWSYLNSLREIVKGDNNES